MRLDTTTYSASHGYVWSSVPACASLRKLNQLFRYISSARGDFPDTDTVDAGLVSDGSVVAAFTLQNVDNWDCEKRASDYAALALFTIEQAANIDFVELLGNPFFWTPSHQPKSSLVYAGPPSAEPPAVATRRLQKEHQYLLREPRAIGALLARCAQKSSRWICLMKAENALNVECNK